MALRAQWRKFAEEYLKCWNQTDAAILAGYSERSAYNQGARLMKNDDVRAYIDARIDELAMSANEVVLRLSQQARADYARYLTVRRIPVGDGDSQSIEMPVFDFEACRADGNLHLIKKVKYKDGLPAEVEFYDAQTALIKLGQHRKLFGDEDKAIEVNIGLHADDLHRLYQQARDDVVDYEARLLGGDDAGDSLPAGDGGDTG